MSEIARVEAASIVDFHRPDLQEWAANLEAAHRIGTALCATSFAPVHFRGKPAEAAAAILYGSEVGFTPTQALQNLYVIGGKPALYARPMVAIVQAAGHKVWTESKTDTSVTVKGQRRGLETVETETWDIARAKLAGYTSNKKYQTDPQAMLYARAASDICRRIAADALAGMAFSVEELELSGKTRDTGQPITPQVTADDFTDPPGEPVDADVVTGEEAEPKLSDEHRRKMFATLTRKGCPEDRQAEFIAQTIGRPVEHRDAITVEEYDAVIARLAGLDEAVTEERS